MDGGASGSGGRGGHGLSESRNTALGTCLKAGANGERGDLCRPLLSSTSGGLISRLWTVDAGVPPLGTLLGTCAKAGANGERDDFCRHLFWIISRIWEAGAGVSPLGTSLSTCSKADANGERDDFCRHLLSSTDVGMASGTGKVDAGILPLGTCSNDWANGES